MGGGGGGREEGLSEPPLDMPLYRNKMCKQSSSRSGTACLLSSTNILLFMIDMEETDGERPP